MPNPSMAAAIVGAAESDQIGYMPAPKTALMMHVEAIRNVCAQTGVKVSQIEAVFGAGVSAQVAEYLGIHPKYFDTTSVGGCSFEMHVHHALGAIAAGLFDIALVTHGQIGYSQRALGGGGRGGFGGGDRQSLDGQFVSPYGLSGPPSNYAHAMTRHMHQYGSRPEDFGQIAITTRDWATLNPRAVMHSKETNPHGGPMSMQDYLGSRWIAWPLHLLDCCLQTDHGGAVIVTSADVARSLGTTPVWIAGAGEGTSHSNMLEQGDFTATSARESGEAAYRMAGMGPDEMEMAMIYDSFTITAAITAEMLGLTKRGEGPGLWAHGNAGPGGKFPVNTNGGGLSFNHSGMYGMHLLIEAYRQLSGTAEDGVNGLPGKQTNAQSCVVNGTGGSLSNTGTLVLVAD